MCFCYNECQSTQIKIDTIWHTYLRVLYFVTTKASCPISQCPNQIYRKSTVSSSITAPHRLLSLEHYKIENNVKLLSWGDDGVSLLDWAFTRSQMVRPFMIPYIVKFFNFKLLLSQGKRLTTWDVWKVSSKLCAGMFYTLSQNVISFILFYSFSYY